MEALQGAELRAALCFSIRAAGVGLRGHRQRGEPPVQCLAREGEKRVIGNGG